MSGEGGVRLCLYSPVSRGGAAWFVSALAMAMADAGAQIDFIAPPLEPANREPVHPHIHRIFLPRGGGGAEGGNRFVRAIRSVWRIASTFPLLTRSRIGTREFVVTFYDWLPIQIAQFLSFRMLGARITYIVHDVTPHAWRFPPGLIWLEKRLQRLSYRLPHRVVTLTQAARRDLAENGRRSEGVYVIPHGAFDEGTSSPLPNSDSLLVFGMLRRNKNIVEAIEALRAMHGEAPGVEMVIAGARHVEDMGYWDECATHLEGMDGYVRTEIGFIEEDRLRLLLGHASAVVLPYDDFASASGVAILAAMSGRVLITTDVGGIGELIAHGLRPVLIQRPVTKHSIADAIGRFRALPQDERVNMARDGRAAISDYLSWDRIGREYIRVIGG